MADVFISHVEEGSELAIGLAHTIEAADISTWHYDRDSVLGRTYLEQITEAIDACHVMVVLISTESMGSHQVAKEIEYAHDAGKSFLPVLVDISQADFQKRRKDWHLAFGAATSIRLGANRKDDFIRIVQGIHAMLGREARADKETVPEAHNEPSAPSVLPTNRPGLAASPAQNKASHVFISYSQKDKEVADVVCATLEAKGIRCWIAPRDIPPGVDWGGLIARAISDSHLMVLVFSSNANRSQQIRREVEYAMNCRIPIIPLRIENVKPVASLEYFSIQVQWLDAFTPPLETHLEHLVKVVRRFLASGN